MPHLTIGKTADPQQAKALVDQVNQRSFARVGTIEALDVIRLEQGSVPTLARIPLEPIVN